MRIFVTGATGVIGRRVVPILLTGRHHVSALARSAEKRAAFERLGVNAVDVSLFDPAALRDALAGHDAVVNLATHLPKSMRIFRPGAWHENDRVRREGSGNLVDAAIAVGVERFLQESFAPVYPSCGDRWINEDTPIAPVAYNATVADAERSAQRFTGSGRTGIVLRFAYFYGPDAAQVIDAIRFARHGWALLPGAPQSYCSSVSHDDAAGAVVAALGARAGAYNVSDDEPLTRREYFDLLAKALGVAPPKIAPPWVATLFGSLGKMLTRSQRISNRKLRGECGWAPRYPSMREGWPAVVRALDDKLAHANPPVA
jgi:nucleoside-diphosphate-sugar epimerase